MFPYFKAIVIVPLPKRHVWNPEWNTWTIITAEKTFTVAPADKLLILTCALELHIVLRLGPFGWIGRWWQPPSRTTVISVVLISLSILPFFRQGRLWGRQVERGVLEAEGGVCRRGRSGGEDGGRPRPADHLPHRAGLRHDQVTLAWQPLSKQIL